MYRLKDRRRQIFELTAEVYKRDVRVRFSRLHDIDYATEAEKEQRRPKRAKIIKFSWRWARRLRHLIRNSEDLWKGLITLTYPSEYPCNGRKTKAQLNTLLQFLRCEG